MENLRCSGMNVEKCDAPITHIDSKGYVYCLKCGERRKASTSCRKLTAKEIKTLESGNTISYRKPKKKIESLMDEQNRNYSNDVLSMRK